MIKSNSLPRRYDNRLILAITAICLLGAAQAAWGVDYYLENFETGLGGFTLDNSSGSGHGLWHRGNQCLAAEPGHSGAWVLYYGSDTMCTYAVEDPPGTSAANQGSATSPEIDLTGAAGKVLLEFHYRLHTQNASGRDIATVEISANGGAFQILRTQGSGLIDPSGTWRKAIANLTPWIGSTVQLRFGFNTVDSQANGYPGYAVDDVRVHDGLEPVVFADPKLKTAVEATLLINNPTKADMLGLTSLSATANPPLGIGSLAGLEYALNLQSLDAGGNLISDISPLSGLSGLYVLYLSSNQVSDISILSNLHAMMIMGLKGNQISDAAALSGMSALWWLDLIDNQIIDISPLAGLTSLQGLFIHENPQDTDNPLNTPSYCRWIPQIQANNPGITLVVNPNPNILTNDCSTDVPELEIWLQQWLDAPCSAENNWCDYSDLNHDGRVDAADFAILAELWLQ
jgi:hypothetical protein